MSRKTTITAALLFSFSFAICWVISCCIKWLRSKFAIFQCLRSSFSRTWAKFRCSSTYNVQQLQKCWRPIFPSTVQGYLLNVENYQGDPLDTLMNGDVKAYLGIPDSVTWGGQSNAVFNAQAGDFMKPVIDTGALLLRC